MKSVYQGNPWIGFASVAMIALLTSGVAFAESLAEVKATHEKSLASVREAARAEIGKLDAQLTGALQRGQEAARKAGDLDLAKAYQNEVDLIELVGEPADVPSHVPAIEKFQEVYKTSREAVDVKRFRAIMAWQKSYDLALAALEKSLVTSGEIDEAEEVRAARREAETRTEVVEARSAVANLPEPAKPESGNPTPAPMGSNKPWSMLARMKWAKAEGDQWFKAGLEQKGTLEVKGRRYTYWRDLVYLHPTGTITYEFPSPITEFQATGCLQETSNQGNVIFVITTSEGEVFRGKPVTKERTQEEISIKFKPTTHLTLTADPNGGGQEDWAFLLKPQYR